MSNLLSAGMYRLKYSKLFYILLGLLVVTLTFCYVQAIPQTVSLDVSPTEAVTQEEGYVTVEYEEQASFYPLNSLFFQYVLFNLISCGVFCPLFLSHEYSDGVLRNKLIVGRNRTQIYLGNLTVNGLYGATATVLGILTDVYKRQECALAEAVQTAGSAAGSPSKRRERKRKIARITAYFAKLS